MKSKEFIPTKTWYPYLIFYDLQEKKIAQQIVGGEIFVESIDDDIFCVVQENFPLNYYQNNFTNERPLKVNEEGHLLETKYWLKRYKFSLALSDHEMQDLARFKPKQECVESINLSFAMNKTKFRPYYDKSCTSEAYFHGKKNAYFFPCGDHLSIILGA